MAAQAATPPRLAADRSVPAAFLAIVVLGGANGVAVHFSDVELAPLWGAAIRFVIAAAVLFGIVGVRRIALPRGAALTGSVVYGLLAFAGAFGFIYWGLVKVPPGLAQIILALVPLLTFLFAVVQGLERFRWQSLGGALLAIGGIGVVFGSHISAAVPLAYLAAIVVAAASMAESNVVAKRFPKCHPVANNAVAMGAGGAVLLVASFLAGEPHALPVQASTLAAIGYVSLVGSVGVFSLFLYVLARWSASSSSYVMLLMPLVAVIVASALTGETITTAYFVGGGLVLLGVYIGAFAPPLRTLASALAGLPNGLGRPRGGAIAATAPSLVELQSREPPSVVTPGCA
jgi:drug/metabolite transporter (DMT)-like permease